MKKYDIEIQKGVIQDNPNDNIKFVYLCRHGETDAAKNKYYAPDDISLNEVGIQDAMTIKQIISMKNIVIYSSPFKRALETSRVISDQFIIIDELKERNYGDWKGKNKYEICRENPIKYYLGKYFPCFISPKNGERLFRFYKRREQIMDLIWNSMEEYSLIVTHGSIIHSLMMYPSRKCFANYWKYTKKNNVSCGEIYTLKIHKL